jgi:hypothetical protein
MWKVTIHKIVWDDGKGEYDVSELPKGLIVVVNDAFDSADAIEQALETASDSYGSLIESSECSAVELR